MRYELMKCQGQRRRVHHSSTDKNAFQRTPQSGRDPTSAAYEIKPFFSSAISVAVKCANLVMMMLRDRLQSRVKQLGQSRLPSIV